MRALISGINGFVGRYLEEYLKRQGHEVFGLEVEGSRKRDNVFYGDIRDKNYVNKVIEDTRPDRVYHLSAISFVPHSDIEEIYNVNFLGTLNLYEALKKSDRKVRLLFVSSSNVYGAVPQKSQPIREDFPLAPNNHYAVSKAGGEMLSNLYRGVNLEIVIARPFNHTGVGQNISFVVPKIVNAFRKKEASMKLGNIDAYRDFSDVRDVVKAYYTLLQKGKDGEVYNVCSGRTYSIRDVIGMLSEISGHEIRVEQDESLMRSVDIPYVIGDNSRIMKATGWKPEIGFSETLKAMYHENSD